MSTPTVVAPEATPGANAEANAGSALPYNDAVPGAVVGTWADDTDKALFVAPDKLLALLAHLRDREGYDFLSSVTCVDYSAYKGKARGGIAERFDVVYHLYSTQEGRRPRAAARARARERDGAFGHERLSGRQPAGA